VGHTHKRLTCQKEWEFDKRRGRRDGWGCYWLLSSFLSIWSSFVYFLKNKLPNERIKKPKFPKNAFHCPFWWKQMDWLGGNGICFL
jgi:hypothetical protein